MKLKNALSTLILGLSFTVCSSTFASSDTINNESVTQENIQEKIDYGYEKILLEEILEYEKNNPTLSSAEIDAYFLTLVEKYNRNNKDLDLLPEDDNEQKASRANDTNFIYKIVGGTCGLNNLEQQLFNSSPTKGFKACVAGKEAQDYTIFKFGYNGHNDKTDAFRHAAWNIIMIGFTNDAAWTKRWTDAHEDGNPTQPIYEYNMDVNNNVQGIYKAQEAGISDSSSLAVVRTAIDQLYKSGKLQYINPANGIRAYFVGKNSDYIN